jgi:hypothetical protein
MENSARFWNRNTSTNDPDFLGMVTLKTDVGLFLQGNDSCWSSKFLTCMAHLGLTGGRSVSSLKRMDVDSILSLKFPENDVVDAFTKVYERFKMTNFT